MLFYRLIVSVDDYGRYWATPEIVKGRLFPLANTTVTQVEDALNKLSTEGMIRVYEVDGKLYLELCNWTKFQTPRAAKSKFPAAPVNTQGNQHSQTDVSDPQASVNKCKQLLADAPDIRYSVFDIRNSISDIPPLPPKGEDAIDPSDAISNKPEPADAAPISSRRRKPSQLSKTQEARFNRFWEVYPKKVSIGDAEKAWAKVDPDDTLAERIIQAVTAAKRFDTRFREKQYTPHPASWLNGKEWMNEYQSRAASPKTTVPSGNPFKPFLTE
ncbi:hypothetical protein LJC33_00350 [Eubacteriales bacterium OttesenSCG-928-N13]|nr:hypothetical protein [Eubacteriales bacterium OttesenSCG-928-N13]